MNGAKPPDDPRAELISDAVQLAVSMSKEGTTSLSAFLDKVGKPLGDAASETLHNFPSTELTRQGGRVAGEVATVALDMVDAARQGLADDPALRSRTVDRMSDLVTFFGSMFIDTANRAVGVSAGQPATNRARLVTAIVKAGKEGSASLWVVNRGPVPVTNQLITFAPASGITGVKATPPEVSIEPRHRARIDLVITHGLTEPGSFADVLVFIPTVGSTVVRVVVAKEERERERGTQEDEQTGETPR